MQNKPNRLINEKSPYLLQHAFNPVDWYPWGEEAFNKAYEEDIPIFLSIGYSTCHWCHVMEKESFEDFETAKLLNDSFICVKLDREERPDIDAIYMSVCQLVTGSGGWPLTIIITPDKKPFLAGTYFPKTTKHNRVGLLELIPKINEIWNNDREKVFDASQHITDLVLKNYKYKEIDRPITQNVLQACYEHLEEKYDDEFGGFGMSPKFPTPQNLMFLLRYNYFSDKPDALVMTENTALNMRLGGIFDQIGGGFHRYSTDKNWLLPHFEKMLYDQALIAYSFTELYSKVKKEFLKTSVENIFNYVSEKLTSPEGAFYSAEDADSDGEEGKFYFWKSSEIRELLKDSAEDFLLLFNFDENGNFLDPFKGEKDGNNIPFLKSEKDFTKINSNSFKESISKLYIEREKRIHPHLDDKILTDWNGLMIAALAKAYSVFGEKKYLDMAINSFEFIDKHLTDKNGLLLHRFRDNNASFEATLNDYAFLIFGLTELYFATYDTKYIKKALSLNGNMIRLFADIENGGFFLSSENSEDLLFRPKEIYDGAIPSANSVLLFNFFRLGHLTGNTLLLDIAERTIKAFYTHIASSPSSYSFFVSALYFYLNSVSTLVITKKSDDNSINDYIKMIQKEFKPNVLLNVIDPDSEEAKELFEFSKNFVMIDNLPTLYVCHGFNCKLPTTDFTKLNELLNNNAKI